MEMLMNADETHVDDVDKNNRAPLMLAAMPGHVECVKLLLLHKPNIRLKDKDGDTAIDHARVNKFVDVIQLLEDDLKKK